MKFPTWSDFSVGLSKFENYLYEKKISATDKLKELKDNHPLFDDIMKTGILILPPPFDKIAKAIYNNFEGSNEDRVNEVIKFLHDMKANGEEHYNNIVSMLDLIIEQNIGVKAEITAVKTITAKEETLLVIKDLLESGDIKNIKQQIDEISRTLTKLRLLRDSQRLEREEIEEIGIGDELAVNQKINISQVKQNIINKHIEDDERVELKVSNQY